MGFRQVSVLSLKEKATQQVFLLSNCQKNILWLTR